MKTYNHLNKLLSVSIPIVLMSISNLVYGFVSDSTGADGAFNPVSSTQLTLPPSGIFNFTDVNIPAGIAITFTRNEDNTPVRILATGNVTINGEINVNGGNGGPGNNNPNTNPGIGGPGGFNGGRGGLPSNNGRFEGGDGTGPGRGTGAANVSRGNRAGSASYSTFGSDGRISGNQGRRGILYGVVQLLPLLGGSGGGGGAGNVAGFGGGGGGGGGAILIAATGAATVNGTISALGGNAGSSGGSGSGGAIRIVATTIQGNGTITARGGIWSNTSGGQGRIRLETENLLRTSTTTPVFSFSPNAGAQLIPNIPSIRISAVGGTTAPANPTGSGDVVLPGVTANPVTVDFQTSNIPAGTVLTLIAAPERGTAVTASSSAIAASGSASASINMPNGNSRLTAQTTFTVTASLGKDFSMYAQGEQVEKVRVGINAEGQSETTFITISGKEFTVPSNAVAMN